MKKANGQLALRLVAAGTVSHGTPNTIDRNPAAPWRSFAAVIAAGAVIVAVTFAL